MVSKTSFVLSVVSFFNVRSYTVGKTITVYTVFYFQLSMIAGNCLVTHESTLENIVTTNLHQRK